MTTLIAPEARSAPPAPTQHAGPSAAHVTRPAALTGAVTALGTLLPIGRPGPVPESVAPPGRIERFHAPARFDVHQAERFADWVDARSDSVALVVDCSAIEFVDVAAIEAIARARAARDIELANLSLAALLTFQLLDRALDTAPLLEAA